MQVFKETPGEATGSHPGAPRVVFTTAIAGGVVNATYRFLLDLKEQTGRGRDRPTQRGRASTMGPGPPGGPGPSRRAVLSPGPRAASDAPGAQEEGWQAVPRQPLHSPEMEDTDFPGGAERRGRAKAAPKVIPHATMLPRTPTPPPRPPLEADAARQFGGRGPLGEPAGRVLRKRRRRRVLR